MAGDGLLVTWSRKAIEVVAPDAGVDVPRFTIISGVVEGLNQQLNAVSPPLALLHRVPLFLNVVSRSDVEEAETVYANSAVFAPTLNVKSGTVVEAGV